MYTKRGFGCAGSRMDVLEVKSREREMATEQTLTLRCLSMFSCSAFSCCLFISEIKGNQGKSSGIWEIKISQ